MDPAEEIVNSYLHSRGYFTITNTKVGLKEIDIVALQPKSGHKLHAEVHISLKPTGRIRPWGPLAYAKKPLRWRVLATCNNKFVGSTDKTTGRPTDRIVEKQVKKLLGGSDYEKWYVVGRIHTRDPVGDVAREFERNGVKLVFFEDLLADLKKSLTGIHMDNARRYIELCDAFLGRGPRASIQSPGS